MDNVFLLPDGDRALFLRCILVQPFGAIYICLWEYNSRPLRCLIYKDGFFCGDENQPSSSLGSSGVHRLFNEYARSAISIDVNNDRIPGLALKNNHPYIELQGSELLTNASSDIQRQFYQTAVFMACNLGEIELGFSSISQVDKQMAMRNLFPDDFCRLSQPHDWRRPSSSASSMRSFSTNSLEYSSYLLFNVPSTISPISEILREIPTTQEPLTTIASTRYQQAIHAFAQLPNIQLSNLENDEAAAARALLAAFYPPTSTSSSDPIPPLENLNYSSQRVTSEASAFKNYSQSCLGQRRPLMRSTIERQSMIKRSITFFRNLNLMRLQERSQITRPTAAQMHHVIRERRRRETLNEKFQSLRELLPPGTKKNKGSILISAKHTLTSLMDQIQELSKRNEQLEEHLTVPVTRREAKKEAETSSVSERITVRTSDVTESTSEGRLVDLQVTLRTRYPPFDLLICLMEFIKQDPNVALISTDANTHFEESTHVNHVTLRLLIEGCEWDESAFREAIRNLLSHN